MHKEAMDFVRANCRPGRVCEFGSYNVNGSARELYQGWDYVGVDLRPGRGVDVVADFCSPQLCSTFAGQSFDVIVSTEAFEHCKDWQNAVFNAFVLLKPGGRFLITAAGPKRAVHNNDGGSVLADGEHYANIDPVELERVLKEHFPRVTVTLGRNGQDVYASAWK